MKKLKKKWVVFACIATIFVIFLLLLPLIGSRGESFYYDIRVNALKRLWSMANIAIPSNLDILALAKNGKGVIYPYDYTCPTICSWELEGDPSYYQKILRYKVIKCDNWWGIVELEYGFIGKYFLMITKDGEIIKFDKPFLPEQKLAEYPPKYDIDKHIYPVYLDTLYSSHHSKCQ